MCKPEPSAIECVEANIHTLQKYLDTFGDLNPFEDHCHQADINDAWDAIDKLRTASIAPSITVEELEGMKWSTSEPKARLKAATRNQIIDEMIAAVKAKGV